MLGHYMGRVRNIIKIDVSFNGDATMDATKDVIRQTKIDCSLRAEAQLLDRKEIAILKKKQAHDCKQASLVQLKTLKLKLIPSAGPR